MIVDRIQPKSYSLEDLQIYIAELSSVVRDKEPKSAEKLFNRLLTESVGDKASRVLEYIPCKIHENRTQNNEPIQYFGFRLGDGYYYTNARKLLNWGWSMNEVLSVVDFTNYAVFKIEAPWFLYAQGSTHNQITTISHSQRYAECDRGYWCPPEVKMSQEEWNKFVRDVSPNMLRDYMKWCGITRKEIFDRGADMLQNRVFVMGGYTNNPNAWGHFLEQRLDTHTQKETREFTMLLDEQLTIQ